MYSSDRMCSVKLDTPCTVYIQIFEGICHWHCQGKLHQQTYLSLQFWVIGVIFTNDECYGYIVLFSTLKQIHLFFVDGGLFHLAFP